MKSHGMSTQHNELRPGVVQDDEQVAEIVGQLDHVRRDGTNRYGVSARR